MEPARVVGMPRAKTASLHKNSRMLERKTLRPSACLKEDTRKKIHVWLTTCHKKRDKQHCLQHSTEMSSAVGAFLLVCFSNVLGFGQRT